MSCRSRSQISFLNRSLTEFRDATSRGLRAVTGTALNAVQQPRPAHARAQGSQATLILEPATDRRCRMALFVRDLRGSVQPVAQGRRPREQAAQGRGPRHPVAQRILSAIVRATPCARKRARRDADGARSRPLRRRRQQAGSLRR